MEVAEDILQMFAMYGASVEKLKIVGVKYAPLFDFTDASRAKTLGILEEFLAKVAKEEDGGKAVLTEILTHIAALAGEAEKLTIDPVVKEEFYPPKKEIKVDPDGVPAIPVPKSDTSKDSSSGGTGGSKVVGTYSFRKDFKITGQIGDPKAGLSFTSYRRQVEDGQRKGYKDTELIEGIIRAIQPQNKLRSYLEGRPGLELGEVNSIIRSYYKEQTATELYQQLSTLTQEQKESPQDFLFRALDLRQRVIFASKEKTKKDSGMTYDTKLVQNMTLHALSTGLKDGNIRHSLESTLKRDDVTDEELIATLNSITTREEERKSKFIKVNQLTVESETRGNEETFGNDLKRLEAEVAMLKENIKQKNGDGNSSSTYKKEKPTRRCKWCENGTDRCDHYFKCGSTEHFARGCKQKKSQQQENSQGLH